MKSKYRSVLLALVALLALSAVAASAASAASPEFKPVPTKKKFTSSSGLVVLTAATTSISCSKSTTAGEITSASSLGKIVVKFTGCKIATASCNAAVNSVAAKEGEVVTDLLKGELGTVNTKEAASGVGLLLLPETKTTITTFAADACLPEFKMGGDVAAEVTPIGKKQLTSTFVFTAAAGHTQKIKKIVVKGVNESPELEGWGTLWSVEASDEVSFEEALEIT